MKILIKNIGKIKKSQIEISGITVIAGNNNTGKSTIGKTLFSVFNSVYDINNKIYVSRNRELMNRYRKAIRNILFDRDDNKAPSSTMRSISRDIDFNISRIYRQLSVNDSYIDDNDRFLDEFNAAMNRSGYELEESELYEIREALDEAKRIVDRIDDEAISVELIERYFKNVFDEQICSLNNNDESEILLNIHDQKQNFVFKNDVCERWERTFDVMHEAFLIDNPFIIDDLNDFYVGRFNHEKPRDFLLSKIQNENREEQDNIISAVIAKEKLSDINQLINNIVPEDIQNKNGEWVAVSNGSNKELHIGNLSAGIKSFLLIKVLLERGILKEKDVLILDEPEIHLHPEWQIKYAEIIVLLQKEFDLSIVVTTHSRDFFEALDLYSQKYKTDKKCNYYLAEEFEDGIEFKNVNNTLSEIYKHLVTPSQLLDKLKFEMETIDND